MLDEDVRPVFDEVVGLDLDEGEDSDVTSLVIHRNATGRVFCCHSPLNDDPVSCTLCEVEKVKVFL